jgi:hypothetical protein
MVLVSYSQEKCRTFLSTEETVLTQANFSKLRRFV